MGNLKFNLLNAMSMLSQLETNTWKSKAYKNAYYILSKVDESDLETKDNFTYLPGIGSGISSKIVEYRDTGRISKLVALMAERGTELPENEYKVRKGYVSKRLPYDRITKILNELNIVDSDDLMVVGSYRRQSNSIADIDLLAFTEQAYWDEVGRLSEIPGCILLVSGSEKTSFRYNNPENTQVDVNMAHGNKWTQLLHHTGSKDSNIRLRGIAKKLGYTLNQYGLNGYNGEINSEVDIFNALGVPYVDPKFR
jgi:DNA polymerase/3'-5' exonuclease PolX